ncbi:MAG: ribbon-helix-helix domain-containing protein [Eubacteriales bacterium]|nr:ribbon-helix-helix domain-containing protein [Eubacteriales bacterium]
MAGSIRAIGSPTITIRIGTEMLKRVNELASEQGVSGSDIIRQAIKDYIARQASAKKDA